MPDSMKQVYINAVNRVTNMMPDNKVSPKPQKTSKSVQNNKKTQLKSNLLQLQINKKIPDKLKR